MTSDVLSVASGSGSARVGRSARRRRRIARVQRLVAPLACTSADAVEAHALALSEDVVAMAEYERELILAIARRTCDPDALAMLHQLAIVVLDRRESVKLIVAFLHRCVGKLREAEERRDWDGLAELRCFTGKELAALLAPVLDEVGDSMVLDPRLVHYFETFDVQVFAERITYGLHRARRATLDRQFAAWRRLGAGRSAAQELALPWASAGCGGSRVSTAAGGARR